MDETTTQAERLDEARQVRSAASGLLQALDNYGTTRLPQYVRKEIGELRRSLGQTPPKRNL